MSSYQPVDHAVRGVPVAYNGSGGTRREWWWQSGPVDSCCCCCPLRSGVGVLASLNICAGLFNLFFWIPYLASKISDALNEINAEIRMLHCSEDASVVSLCGEMLEVREELIHVLSIFNNMPIWYYIPGVLAIVLGFIGLTAVIRRSSTAARWYMMAYPVCFVIGVIVGCSFIAYVRAHSVHVDTTSRLILIYAFSLIEVMYYTKVIWSYYVRTKQANIEGFSHETSAALQLGSRV